VKRVLQVALIAVVAAYVALCIWLRVTSLGSFPTHSADESFYGIQVLRALAGQQFTVFTGSGNLMDPFYALMQVPLLLFLNPDLWVLRIPALVCGLLLVALTYRWTRRFLDPTTGTAAALLTLAHPTAIIYCRCGYEYSQTPLVSLIVLTMAFRGSAWGLLLAFAGGLVVHPTNCFLAPIALPVFLVKYYRRFGEDRERARRHLVRAFAAAGVVLAAVMIVLAQRPILQPYLKQIFAPKDWGTFLNGFARFHLGLFWNFVPETAFRTESRIFWSVVLVASVIGLPRLVVDRAWDRLALIGGLIVSASVFHVIAGSGVFSPGIYRYGSFLIVPSILAFAILLNASASSAARWFHALPSSRVPIAIAFGIGCALLWTVHARWFGYFTERRAESLWTIKSDTKEMYARAFDLIRWDMERERGEARGTIIGQDFGTWRPMEYLAFHHKAIHVETLYEHHLPWEKPAYWEATAYQEARLAKFVGQMSAGAYALCEPFSDIDRIMYNAFPGNYQRWVLLDPVDWHAVVIFHVRSEAKFAARRSRRGEPH
jgi:hypothetical protein